MAGIVYRYELHRADALVAAGFMSSEAPFQVGARIAIGGRQGIVRTIEPLLVEREVRMVVQLFRDQ